MKLWCQGLVALTFAAVLLFLMPRLISGAGGISGEPNPQRRSQSRRVQKKAAAPKKLRVDYAEFSHQTHAVAQKLACSSCHKVPSRNWKEVRKGDTAFPDVADFPEHSSCLNCHRQQFFAHERPAPAICWNCHIAVTPHDTSRWLFPSLGDVADPQKKTRETASEFGVSFPHDKHIDVVGLNAPRIKRPASVPFVFVSGWQKPTQKEQPAEPKSCPVCHQTYQPQGNSSEEYVTKPPKNLGDTFWLKKGTFKTTPNSHTVCFTCHNTDAEIAPLPSDCNVCHKLLSSELSRKVDFDPKLAIDMGITDKRMLSEWRQRISAGAFRHEGGEHPTMNCLNCHNVTAMNTLDRKTLKVPVKSCGGAEGCHITATTGDGGILNFEIDQKKKEPAFVCTKCHIVFGKKGVPEDHLKAIPTPAPKKEPSL